MLRKDLVILLLLSFLTVARVKILGKIKKDDEIPTTEIPEEVLGDAFTPALTETSTTDVESSSEDPTKLVVMKDSSPQSFQKATDEPPTVKTNGSVPGFILGRYKRSLGLRGAPPPRGDPYRPIGGNHRDNGMMYYDVLIKKVFKGEDKVRKTRGTFIDAANPSRVFAKIYFSRHHGQDLEPGVAYMLSGKIMDNNLILPSRGCWYEKWHELSSEEVHGLHGKYAENCDCTIKFCIPGPHCKMMQSFTHSWCDWELRNFREPARDCGAKHNICAKRHGVCHWTTGLGFHSCLSPSGSYP